MIATLDFTILYIGYTFSGKNHDFGMFKKEFNNYNIIIDLDYKGFDKNYVAKNIYMPHKKPNK